MPANVNIGEACSHPAPDHCGKPFGIMATFRWRTTTPFGRPVVPDVYIRSAMSSPSSGTWMAEQSGSVASSHTTEPWPAAGPVVTMVRSSGRSARAAASTGVVDAPLTAATAPAWLST